MITGGERVLAKRPTRMMAAHGSAKAALVQFARYVAEEFGSQGITANIVSPGLVLTDATTFQPEENLRRVASMTPLGHVATPEDVAHAIAMYCSDDSRFITGTYIPVNGGGHRWIRVSEQGTPPDETKPPHFPVA